MDRYYKNLFKNKYGDIIYLGKVNGDRRWVNATHDYETFKDGKAHLTNDELDIFIFEYELKTGFKPYDY